MEWEWIAGGVSALGLLIYLTFTMLHPERF
jgi:K+-transporting ATPase KdpF subunit